jgi:hypothetical protein
MVVKEVEAVVPASTNGHSEYLTRDLILAVNDLQQEAVDVPEWGGKVLVRGMTGYQRDQFERTVLTTKGRSVETNWENFRAKLLVWTLVDGEGTRLFKDADIIALGKKSAAAVSRVFEVASRLSGLTGEDVEELTEGLKETPSGDSGSD